MSSQSIRLLAETVRTLAHGSIAAPGTYTGIGTSINNPARMFLIQNFTNADLMFSFDGINDHFPLLNHSHFILDISSNKTRESGFYLAEGQRIYVTQIEAPTTGSVYLTVFYGKG